MTINEQTRRGFLKLSGALSAAVALGGLDSIFTSKQKPAGPFKYVVINDFDFYRALEGSIRANMKRFEADVVLSLAKAGVRDGKLESKVRRDIPIEGYYHENDALRETFFLLRTLQREFTPEITPSIKELHNIYDPRINHIFGLHQAQPTAINSSEVMYKNNFPVTISAVMDPIGFASEKVVKETGGPNWTINNIMDNIDAGNLGTSLVGLAYLVDKKSKKSKDWNPVASCMACETTVLSRQTYWVIGGKEITKRVWKVSPEVEVYGNQVIEGYNKLFQDHRHDASIPRITEKNICYFLGKAPGVNRVVKINVDATREPRYYHWGILPVGDGEYCVVDFFDKKIQTSEDWQNHLHRKKVENLLHERQQLKY